MWSNDEVAKSSTWRELHGARLILESLACKLHNERLRWFTDYQNMARILISGSKTPHLQTEALAVFSLCIKHSIHLEPEWIPRSENQQADYISRLVDYDDWKLNPGLFAWLDSKWGPHTIDQFADMNNTQLERFNPRFWNPDSEGVDTCGVVGRTTGGALHHI